ncbi:MAG: TadE/TadG family type IV pilus assembly protein [Paracoccaceae bacterium]
MKIVRNLKKFRGSEDGTVTVEFVLWLPLIAGALMLVTDATLLMSQKSRLYDVVRDASRQVSLGKRTPQAAQEAIVSRLSGNGVAAEVKNLSGYVTSTASIPFADAMVFSGYFAGNARMTASVSMWIENDGTS